MQIKNNSNIEVKKAKPHKFSMSEIIKNLEECNLAWLNCRDKK